MAKVFILNPREGVDFSPAEEYGELVPIGKNISPSNFEMISEAMENVASMMAEEDYVLPTASMASSVMMAYLIQNLMMKIYGDSDKLNVLVYDSKACAYRKRVMSV